MAQLSTILKSALYCALVVFSLEAKSSAVLFDTCAVNDVCQTATPFAQIVSDQAYVCMPGCNLNAAPDPEIDNCQMGDYPTVWYEIPVDASATILNIIVRSEEFESPVISLFDGSFGCGGLVPVKLTNGNVLCVMGSNGIAKAIGTELPGNGPFYLAVSSLTSIGGHFEVCVGAISKGSYCVLDRDLMIKARSNGGPLEGPFDSGEKVTVCMNVNSYTAANNGCQWFQGIIPVFGNGWDPSSFDANGQPLNATVNGYPIGEFQNGIYGVSTWDWFTNVGYHHPNPWIKVGDFDNNGRVEMCNGIYEIDCPVENGLSGGCCGPCWNDQGEILPPGWFAHKINGSCPDTNEVRFDWGDGNTCGGSMGPWSFCFEVVARSHPECLDDSTKQDLSLGYFTFADGEVGAWTGANSVCALDQPVNLSFMMHCSRVIKLPPQHLPQICSGDTFQYELYEEGISHWDWNISPAWAAPVIGHSGDNGITIQTTVKNETHELVEVTALFIGHAQRSQDVTIKKVHFKISPCNPFIDIPDYVGNEKPVKVNPPSTDGNITENIIETRSSEYANALKVFPVPSKDRVVIQWPGLDIRGTEMKVFDVHGKQIEQIKIDVENNHSHEIDISNYTDGVYFISLISNGRIYAAKLIKN